MTDPASTFLRCVDDVRPLFDLPALAERWGEPSPLERMSIGELAGHTARALFNVVSYLDSEGTGEPVDAAGYYLALDGVRAPDLDDDLARAVRARAAEEASAGPADLRRRWDEARTEVAGRLAALDGSVPLVGVLGSAMLLDDYLVTRMVELVVHADDLAVGLGTRTPDFDETVWNEVLATLWAVARRRSAPSELVRRMTRVERSRNDPLRVL